MFSPKALFATITLFIVISMMSIPARVAADRSFYAPGPVNYPRLLPRFGGGNDEAPQAPQPTRGVSNGGQRQPANAFNLGTRIGDRNDDYDRNQRVRPSSSSFSQSSSGSQQQRVPCLNCVVYISRSGQITRYNPVSQNDLTP